MKADGGGGGRWKARRDIEIDAGGGWGRMEGERRSKA